MTIRMILVPLSGDDVDARALAAAGTIAVRHKAHIRALYAEPDPSDLPIAMAGDGSGMYLSQEMLTTLQRRMSVSRTKAEKNFEKWRKAADLPLADKKGRANSASASLTIETGVDAVLLGTYGVVTDLIVAVLPAPEDIERSVYIENGLFEAGRPVLAVPRGKARLPPDNAPIAIAWNGSAESARALTAALPFLELSSEIVLLYAGGKDDDSGIELVGDYLDWHGIKSHSVLLPAHDTGETLTAEAKKLGAGLLVMGAYGHSRAHELVFGGVTRTVLQHATLPVLFAH